MSEKIWLGAIYLKDEGGYDIVLKSLNHYKKRLKSIGDSPELKKFISHVWFITSRRSQKIIPKIDETIKTIQEGLTNIKLLNSLSKDSKFLSKALLCYEADIKKSTG